MKAVTLSVSGTEKIHFGDPFLKRICTFKFDAHKHAYNSFSTFRNFTEFWISYSSKIHFACQMSELCQQLSSGFFSFPRDSKGGVGAIWRWGARAENWKGCRKRKAIDWRSEDWSAWHLGAFKFRTGREQGVFPGKTVSGADHAEKAIIFKVTLVFKPIYNTI